MSIKILNILNIEKLPFKAVPSRKQFNIMTVFIIFTGRRGPVIGNISISLFSYKMKRLYMVL